MMAGGWLAMETEWVRGFLEELGTNAVAIWVWPPLKLSAAWAEQAGQEIEVDLMETEPVTVRLTKYSTDLLS